MENRRQTMPPYVTICATIMENIGSHDAIIATFKSKTIINYAMESPREAYLVPRHLKDLQLYEVTMTKLASQKIMKNSSFLIRLILLAHGHGPDVPTSTDNQSLVTIWIGTAS